MTELIQGYIIARTLESTEAELMETIFPHPTLSETMHEAVLEAYGRVIHMTRPLPLSSPRPAIAPRVMAGPVPAIRKNKVPLYDGPGQPRP